MGLGLIGVAVLGVETGIGTGATGATGATGTGKTTAGSTAIAGALETDTETP